MPLIVLKAGNNWFLRPTICRSRKEVFEFHLLRHVAHQIRINSIGHIYIYGTSASQTAPSRFLYERASQGLWKPTKSLPVPVFVAHVMVEMTTSWYHQYI